MKTADAQKRWNTTVYAKVTAVDPTEERDWYDMAYGFFLALGFTPRLAHSMAARAKGVGTL